MPFSDWPIIFPNAGSAIALIDRLVHHAEDLSAGGSSVIAVTDGGGAKATMPAEAGAWEV